MTQLMTDLHMNKRILVVTNDSKVFKDKSKLLSAFEMFEGRATEVKNLVARLDTATDDKDRKICDVSYGVISARYGFVPGNYMVTGYEETMDTAEEFKAVDQNKGYVEQVSYIANAFDKVIFCMPKELFRLFLEADQIGKGKLIAVTNPEFKEECEKRDWIYLERKGARVGNDNADRIEEIIRELCKQ
ncbi:MAG: hypothetical protein E7Z70_03665 [Thermoplasmata archaeon]|nr:hypothetical protein [Thermoplasmata archaeon]MBR4686302.1 hypothetical protein [Candidatus Methanomethylophilaceae archaeon]WII07183.1 hypothetical protein PED39_06220 [Methanomassiliicoccales archaeon LGM-RCC1]